MQPNDQTEKFPKVHWITLDGDFTDYRPAIGHDGHKVAFERTLPGMATHLYILHELWDKEAKRFIPENDLPQTRPDWNWATDVIALNVAEDNANSVYTIKA